MNVYISMVLFLLIGFFLFLALYDSGSTSSSSSTSTSTSTSLSDDVVVSPNITMNLGASGSLTTNTLTTTGNVEVTGNVAVTGNVDATDVVDASGVVTANQFCIDDFCLDKDNFAALSRLKMFSSAAAGSWPCAGAAGPTLCTDDTCRTSGSIAFTNNIGTGLEINAPMIANSGIRGNNGRLYFNSSKVGC